MKRYRKAADKGHLTSRFNLGIMYTKGRGVEQDYVGALKWYLKAAEQGNENAERN